MPKDQIQNNAYLLCLDRQELSVRAASTNVDKVFGGDAGAVIGKSIGDLLPEQTVRTIRLHRDETRPSPILLDTEIKPENSYYQAIPYYLESEILLEIELRQPLSTVVSRSAGLRSLSDALASATEVETILQILCDHVRTYLGFERVAVYRLSEDGGGEVVTESAIPAVESVLGLHFREEDFPEEAHRMHLREPVLSYQLSTESPVGLLGSLSSEALDHIHYRIASRLPYAIMPRYLSEVGFQSQLNLGIRNNNRIWGLLFANHRAPHPLDYQMRTFAHLAGAMTAQAIAYRTYDSLHRDKLSAENTRTLLRDHVLSASNLTEGLTGHPTTILDALPSCTGVALSVEDQLTTVGKTPPPEEIKKLVRRIRPQTDNLGLYHTDYLSKQHPKLAPEIAAGALFLSLSTTGTEWVVWFRPEQVRRLTYGSTLNRDGRTFQETTEISRGHSLPWTLEEVQLARDLQSFIRDVIMERYAELRAMNAQLQEAYDEMEAFSYTVSHDLRAPLRGIDGFAEILMEDYGDSINDDARDLMVNIQRHAARMNQFITDILELSRVGRTHLIVNDLDLRLLVRDVLAQLPPLDTERVSLEVQPDTPPLRGDERQMRTVLRNLILNALKYSSDRPHSEVTVGYRPSESTGRPGEFFVSDNGIGIAPEHRQRVFGMFHRLVSEQDYPGTGVGLAIVKRIINRHGGEVRIEGQLGEGATFLFFTNADLTATSADGQD